MVFDDNCVIEDASAKFEEINHFKLNFQLCLNQIHDKSVLSGDIFFLICSLLKYDLFLTQKQLMSLTRKEKEKIAWSLIKLGIELVL